MEAVTALNQTVDEGGPGGTLLKLGQLTLAGDPTPSLVSS